MHRYRVTLEPLADPKAPTLQFDADCHDDIVAIAIRVPSRFGLDQNDTHALIASFKLFAELVLKHRNDPPFSALRPALRDFVMALKGQSQPKD